MLQPTALPRHRVCLRLTCLRQRMSRMQMTRSLSSLNQSRTFQPLLPEFTALLRDRLRLLRARRGVLHHLSLLTLRSVLLTLTRQRRHIGTRQVHLPSCLSLSLRHFAVLFRSRKAHRPRRHRVMHLHPSRSRNQSPIRRLDLIRTLILTLTKLRNLRSLRPRWPGLVQRHLQRMHRVPSGNAHSFRHSVSICRIVPLISTHYE